MMACNTCTSGEFLVEKLGNTALNQRLISIALNALERMLVLDPDKRVSATEMLELLLFTEFREPEEETEALPYDHSMDNTEVTLD
ncbi:mitogen-activated protein kinase 12-like isoform X2 [Onychostoma macrolepis]|uniref:mitogen-activated protein kinase 12-like isoform X2 n=1 Tax=Onychostoma macrolepis TaxID=369639 RepID=UPI00272A3921|nr:mitogen-activated protein kinase 12-like isoform X2 [Onychostoma macrolepis]